MKIRVVSLFFLAMAVLLSANQLGERSWELSSPDSSIKVEIFQSEDGRLNYKVLKNGSEVVGLSELGIITEQADFFQIDSIVLEGKTSGSENYSMILGKRSVRNVDFNQITLSCKKGDYQMAVEFRAFNDGVGFRYSFGGEGKLKIIAEHTSFQMKDGEKAWMQAYHKASDAGGKPAYERAFSEIITGTSAKLKFWSEGWCLPALFDVGGNNFVLLADSNLDENYCGVRLESKPVKGKYRVRFPHKADAKWTGEVMPVAQLPFSTPWRVIVVGSAKTIVESTLVDDLADGFDGEIPSWIKPGRAAWDWASDTRTGNFGEQMTMIEKASELGWEYVLVDANWNKWNRGDVYSLIKELCDYAATLDVGVMLWYNSGGPHNIITEQPRNLMHERASRLEEMKKISSLGVKGIKVDFFHSDKQDRITQYIEILEDAFETELLVNFHGCTVPRGWQRTYPHLMTMESVFGGEQYSFAYTKGPRANQNLYYIFTRNVIGSMDYTPVILEKYMAAAGPTYSHALSQAVMFESALQHYASALRDPNRGYQKAFEENPEVKDLLMAVPSTWDSTIFVDGHPSTHAILAREKDGKWFAAGMNGTRLTKEVTFAADFLPEGNYQATIFCDGDNRREIRVIAKQIVGGQPLSVKMKPQGGFTIMFEKL
ncbi:MAG: glycoside hydrolase family 97 catalytic domain-containing protein [Spirochaetales bacterium]|nr:glycoside hydrolase family 97 catalytic domain-containing protein [Spirochaetales bacterium]